MSKLTIKLSVHKYKALSQVAMDIAQIFFASAVIAPILAGASSDKWYIITIGVVCSGMIWVFALYLAEKGKL